MGNSDGFTAAISSRGTNQVVEFNGGYFSFAFGNEIALVIDGVDGFFILNCDERLFEKVKNAFSEKSTAKEAVDFWKDKSKEHEINDWSGDFSEL